MPEYVQPTWMGRRFTCPNCGTLAQQDWWNISLIRPHSGSNDALRGYQVCTCLACSRPSLWRPKQEIGEGEHSLTIPSRRVWPGQGGPPAHEDMPSDVLSHYDEARAVLPASPKAAAALLRVATEALVHHLLGDESRPMLDKGIAELVKREAIRPSVQRACDVLRVTGNSLLHPGQISPEDADGATPEQLFNLVNMIVEQAITEPKQLGAMFEALPEEKRQGIEMRNQRAIAARPSAGPAGDQEKR